jgi:mannose-1-phosphate guanylyltransferase
VVHADTGSVVLYGVSDLVVVAREGLTLVTTVERAADLKTLLDALPERVRDLA